MTDLNDAIKVAREHEQETARRRRQKEIEDVKALVELPAGRRFLWRLMGEARVFHSTFAGEDTHTSAHAEGGRSLGLMVLDDILKAKPSAFAQMQREAQSNNHDKGEKQ
jgi:hypothetical protein